LQKKLFVSSGTVVTTISAVVNTGAAGTLVDLPTPVVTIGKASATDDIVSVAVAPGTKPNTWDVSITPLKPGVVTVKIDVEDIFGVEAMEDIKAKPAVIPIPTANPPVVYVPAVTALVNAPIVFMATVNTPPALALALPDKLLVHTVDATNVPGLLAAFTYTVETYFDLADKGVGTANIDEVTGENTLTAGQVIRDDVCVFSTNPVQPTGAEDPADLATAADMAQVSGTMVGGGEDDDVKYLSAVIVDADTDEADNLAAATGTITLTITCSDDEASVSSSATITVRP
jgi:hypothetical protein